MIYPLASVFVVSLPPLLAGAIVLGRRTISNLTFVLVSLSVGALFGDVFIHLIPELLETAPSIPLISLFILIGIIFFFIFEKFLHWHHEHTHQHTEECEQKILPVGYSSLFSDGLHNFIDGIVIGVSYLAGIEVGIATTIAVVLHEIPQEIGDLGILLHAGFSKTKALLFNFYSGLLAIGGTVIALFLGNTITGIIPFILAFTAGSFIYIAGSDLLPELHKTKHAGHSLIQLAAILLGIALMFLLLLFE